MSLLFNNILSAYCLHGVAFAYLSHCIIWLLAHVCQYKLDHAELKVQAEQVQVEDLTNLDWIKASPGALTNDPCLLLLNLALCFFMIVH
jgi:hypothetical protein